ncbi:ferredoxin--NADP reductase [Stieleria varia]|uniref:ferredoxin--NADP(+) reductase n=1 Tax=Stieleria varia TaxID=2528005 RepID=A0A5C5ZWZ0_9BACT|nr:ferredoxin--NADP reductase [Stieleria varia]TWT91551.1 Ferredoxin--NADP reductase [Stieleria varia]
MSQPAQSEDTQSQAMVSEIEVQNLRSKLYNATVIDRIDCHENLAIFRVRPDAGVPRFQPGQYVTLGLGYWEPRLSGTQPDQVPANKLKRVAQRAYSISCPLLGEDGRIAPVDSLAYLEFYITLVRSSGSPDKSPPVLTPRLFQLAVGDRVAVGKKVVGNYTLGAIAPEDTVLMLGTGTGEAPHNAMTATLLSRGHRGRIVNVTSVRYFGDLGYQPQHERLMQAYPQYRYLSYTTREPINLDPAMPGYVGKQYLQDLFTSGRLAEAAGDPLSPTNTHVFLCGNPSMIGYVPPGGDPLPTPGMLPLLREAGFHEHHEHEGPGRILFEKYW